MKALLTILFFYFATGAVLADDKSGPGRTTLRTFDGGTIYVVEKEATSAKAAPGEVTVKTIKAGKILVKTMPWGFDIVSGQGTIKVHTSLNEIVIEEAKQKVKVNSAFGGKTVVDVPGQKMTFQQGGINDMSVSGAKGTLKVEKELNDLKVVSPVGTTTLVKQFDDFKQDGPPLSRHPYTYRALLLERNGVGILLNLLPYHHEALRPALDWSRVKNI
mgnify:CR=1 FL=1